jgi:antitoxin component HigA of HigAB toxin-antitoxin module
LAEAAQRAHGLVSRLRCLCEARSQLRELRSGTEAHAEHDQEHERLLRHGLSPCVAPEAARTEGKAETVKTWHGQDPRLFAQEGLLLAASEEVWRIMNKRGINKYQLAQRMGCSRAHVTMVLNGTRNMTLRTLADLAHALGYEVNVKLRKRRRRSKAD